MALFFTAVDFREISSIALMELLLPIEIHVAICELQATHRPTIAGLLLQNCVIQVSLLRGLWNSGAAPAGVHRGAAIGFVLHEVVVMCVAVRRTSFTVDTLSILKMVWRVEWPT